MNHDRNHLKYSTWECKYHIVFVPKSKKKVLFGKIRTDLKEVFHKLEKQKECQILEGKSMSNHVYIPISVPPKHSISGVIRLLKGKSAIWIAQMIGNKVKNFTGQKFWVRRIFCINCGDKPISG